MRRILSLLLVAGVLVASATTVATAQGQRPTPTEEARPSEGRGQGAPADEEAETEERAQPTPARERRPPTDPGERPAERERAAQARPAAIGSFVLAGDDAVAGEHLSFSYSTAGIDAFRAHNLTLFDIAVQGDGEEDTEGEPDRRAPRVVSEGAFFRVRMPNFTFSAHDNPGAVGKLSAEGDVTLTFAEGVALAHGQENTVRFAIGNVTGTVRGDDLAISGARVTASDEVLVFLDAARGAFDRHRGEIGRAIAKGHVGAEASFNAQADDEVQQDVVSYGNVTMRTIKAERGNLTVEVEGHGFEGRVLVLNVDGRVLGADRADKLNITLDNLTISSAADLADALDPDDDGFSPEYYLVYDPAAEVFQLIVTVPHYSVHTLSVTTLFEIVPPSVVVGIVVGTLAVVPMALVLFRRR